MKSDAAIGPIPTFEQDRAKSEAIIRAPRLDMRRQFEQVTRGQGLSASHLIMEMGRLATGPGYIDPNEYFLYRLYDPALPMPEKLKFVGRRMQALLHRACNSERWRVLAIDKLIFHTFLLGSELPAPRLLALYQHNRRAPTGLTLQNRAELRQFLLALREPVFAKPTDGHHSLGCIAIDGVEAQTGTVRLAFGQQVAMDAVLDRIEASGERGYLLQERLQPHRDLRRLFGPALATIRMLVFLGESAPELARAVCKIPQGGNIADNFWRGNMLGAIDPETGAITRVVSGVGIDQLSHATHPDTGAELVGATLPCWSEAKRICLSAAASLRGIRTQSWDVAITERGPILVEMNYGGDLILAQVATGRGVLDEQYRAHLRRCGFRLPPFAARVARSVGRHAFSKLKGS